MKWFDSLFARIFVLQIGVATLLAAAYTTLFLDEQAHSAARSSVPLWVAAIKPVERLLSKTGNRDQITTDVVTLPITLVPGPLPKSSTVLADKPLIARYRVFLTELRANGIPALRMAISGDSGSRMTWLEFQAADGPVWIGMSDSVARSDAIQGGGTLRVVLAVCVFVLSAAWFSRVIAKPLNALQASVSAFFVTGKVPAVAKLRAAREIRQLTQQFQALALQRAQQDEDRNLMLAAVSHDLRSPITRIRVAAELLTDNDSVLEMRDSIVRNALVADRLVGSFLTLARTSVEPMDESVDLAALLPDILSTSDHLTTALEITQQDRVWLSPASSDLLERAIVNLLENAHRHGAAPVIVRLEATASQVTLTVRDHGEGIPADRMNAMRKPFSRGAPDRGLPGSGLGLAIVDRIVQRHGGEMTLMSSRPGLEVQLRFPRGG